MKHPSFIPITATPFLRSGYREVMPCRDLAPFVRCFWCAWDSPAAPACAGTGDSSIIIPDVCADIIITIDGDGPAADDRELTSMGFCGVNDRMFRSERREHPHRRLLGIRLFAWQAFRFSDEPLSGTANGFFDLGEHFSSCERLLRSKIAPDMELPAFKAACEQVLLELLDRPPRKTPECSPLVLDAVTQMLLTRGSQSLPALLKDIHAGERQLERLFAKQLALSPKKAASLIRYQSLWQDVCRPHSFDIQDAVLAYGYFDQAHLLNDFRKFHGMGLGEARRNAGLSAIYNTKT